MVGISRLPTPPKEYDEAYMQTLIRVLQNNQNSDILIALRSYRVSNYTESRTLDASAASATDVADFVCTMIADIHRVSGGV